MQGARCRTAWARHRSDRQLSRGQRDEVCGGGGDRHCRTTARAQQGARSAHEKDEHERVATHRRARVVREMPSKPEKPKERRGKSERETPKNRWEAGLRPRPRAASLAHSTSQPHHSNG